MTGTNPHRMNLIALGLMSYVAVFLAARYHGFRILTGAQFDFLPGLVVVAASGRVTLRL